MTRYVRVPIEAEERECGDCQYRTTYNGARYYCRAFRLDDDNCSMTKLETVDGRLQRCTTCLAAEVKAEVKEDGK
jgi:hypothetical protein